MAQLPFDIGIIHFIGIGGIGMSGIAEVMHNLGYKVQGSDRAKSANVDRLQALGIGVFVGQHADNVAGAGVCVISTAIPTDNPELVAAKAQGIPVVRRAEMLAELMRLKWCVSVAGTHGKTTTTSLVAAVLDQGGMDPTVINGGVINTYGTNARLGTGDWMVVEADESDGTFVKLPATIAIVTNIDPEHLDHYGDFDAERLAFRQFVSRIPFYGAAILCVDHPEVQALIPALEGRRVRTYGLSPLADVRAQNIRYEGGGARFDVRLRADTGSTSSAHSGDERVIRDIWLPMPGEHNVQNALAALAVGLEMRLSQDILQGAFAAFSGVKRRFTRVGSGAGREIVDDYGHHPVEIAHVLKAARASFDGKVLAVVQPHRYSRLDSLFDEFCAAFNDADAVIVAPVFAAGETPIEGRDHIALAEGLRAYGHRRVTTIDGEQALAAEVMSLTDAGDAVICLGAGSISTWAHALPAELDAVHAG